MLAVVLLLAILLPIAFGELFASALLKLHLSPEVALLVVVGIFLGSVINIPIRRIARQETVLVEPLAVLGLGGFWPSLQRQRRETIIAVNVGGCLVPAGLAMYELVHIAGRGSQAVLGFIITALINIAVCYWAAQPIPRVGIALPGLLPAAVATIGALMLVPDDAAPVAFAAGVLGPLVGADLLHLRDVSQLNTGMASIGGAGTFDGIVLSGILAAYLA